MNICFCGETTKSDWSIYCNKHYLLNSRYGMPYKPFPIANTAQFRHSYSIGKQLYEAVPNKDVLINAVSTKKNNHRQLIATYFKAGSEFISTAQAKQLGLYDAVIALWLASGQAEDICRRATGWSYLLDTAPNVIRNKGTRVKELVIFTKIFSEIPKLRLKTRRSQRVNTDWEVPKAIRRRWGAWLLELGHKATVLAGGLREREIAAMVKYKAQYSIEHKAEHRAKKKPVALMYYGDRYYPFGWWIKIKGVDQSWRQTTNEEIAACKDGSMRYELREAMG